MQINPSPDPIREIAEQVVMHLPVYSREERLASIEGAINEGVTLRLRELRERVSADWRAAIQPSRKLAFIKVLRIIDSMLTQSGDLVDEGQGSGSYSAIPANQEGGNATTPEPIDKVGGPLADKQGVSE